MTAPRARGFEDPVIERIAVRRPDSDLSASEIVKLHAAGKPVPMTEFTVVLERRKWRT